MNTNQQHQQIITHREKRTTHYHLRHPGGYGRLRPLTDARVRELRLAGVPIDLPETQPLRPFDGQDTAV